MGLRPRPSARARIAVEFLRAPVDRYGYDLVRSTRLKSATVFAILDKMQGQGLLEAHWADEPQPRRRLYTVKENATAGLLEIIRMDRRPKMASRVAAELLRRPNGISQGELATVLGDSPGMGSRLDMALRRLRDSGLIVTTDTAELSKDLVHSVTPIGRHTLRAIIRNDLSGQALMDSLDVRGLDRVGGSQTA